MVTHFGHNVHMSINLPARFWIFKAGQRSRDHLRMNRTFNIIQNRVKTQVRSNKMFTIQHAKPSTANTTTSVISVIQYFQVINLKLTKSQTVTNVINQEKEKTR